MLKAAAATIPSTQDEEFTKQLKRQQQCLDILEEILKIIGTITLQTAQAPNSFRQGGPSLWDEGERKEPLH